MDIFICLPLDIQRMVVDWIPTREYSLEMSLKRFLQDESSFECRRLERIRSSGLHTLFSLTGQNGYYKGVWDVCCVQYDMSNLYVQHYNDEVNRWCKREDVLWCKRHFVDEYDLFNDNFSCKC